MPALGLDLIVHALPIAAALLVAYANGANDSFKGVATLFGTGTAGYRGALGWALATTAAGALAAAVLGAGLLQRFRGKGLVPDALVADPSFLAAVGLASAATVLLATRLGLPVSTTHALMGGLVGAGLVRARTGVSLGGLGKGFLLPLVVSPAAAALLALGLYPLLHRVRRGIGLRADACLCASLEAPLAAPAGPGLRPLALPLVRVGTGTVHACGERGNLHGGTVLALRAQALLDRAHGLSAGALSFARGLNDAPKIAALAAAGLGAGAEVGTWAAGGRGALVAVTAVMTLGGLLEARRVGETMSRGITPMSPGQGLAANLVASGLVLAASAWSLPVSTTHVSCGALFGIGLVTGKARGETVRRILAAWATTLPIAAAAGAAAAVLLAIP